MILLFQEDLIPISDLNQDTSDAWDALQRELDMWQERGKLATLWWRDDDAQLPSAQLDRLIDLSANTHAPLVLATIPERVGASLKRKIEKADNITVVQHGWSHTNHAPSAEKKCELGDHRNLDDIQRELALGAEILTTLFGNLFIPMLVPPWNRISSNVAEQLETYGYRGLSTFGNASIVQSTSGFHQVNTHVDLINWRGDRGFIGTINALQQITFHLHQRRIGNVPEDQPTGILTHHLVHDEELWQFLEELFRFTAYHSAAIWLTGRQIFKS